MRPQEIFRNLSLYWCSEGHVQAYTQMTFPRTGLLWTAIARHVFSSSLVIQPSRVAGVASNDLEATKECIQIGGDPNTIGHGPLNSKVC